MTTKYVNILRLPKIQDKLNSELRMCKFDSRIYRDCKQAIQLYWINEISHLSDNEKASMARIVLMGGVEITYNETLKEERYEFQNDFLGNYEKIYFDYLKELK